MLLVAVGTSLAVVGAALPSSAQPAEVVCGQVITRSTTLYDDVGPCEGDGVIIGADNVILNLNGHRIFGTDGTVDGTAVGIRLPNRAKVLVVGGTVSGFDAGVFINRGGENTVMNMTVRDNIGLLDVNSEFGDGIVVFNSPRNRIANNAVIHNGYYNGIGVWGLGSNGNTIEDNLVEGTLGVPEPERFIREGGEGIILQNSLTFQEMRTGESLHHNRVARNTVRNNESSGISTYSSMDSALVDNLLEGNGTAFPKNDYGSTMRPGGSGINVHWTFRAQRATNVLVERNVVRNNQPAGIVIWTGSNRITRNDAQNNSLLDLWDISDRTILWQQPCDNNEWRGNTWGSPSPILAEFSHPPYLPDCTAAGGSGPGDPGSASRDRRPPLPLSDQPNEEVPPKLRGNPST